MYSYAFGIVTVSTSSVAYNAFEAPLPNMPIVVMKMTSSPYQKKNNIKTKDQEMSIKFDNAVNYRIII